MILEAEYRIDDQTTEIETAAKTATDFIEASPNGSVQIGNKTGGEWSGVKAKVDTAAFQILNDDDTVIAEYGAAAKIGVEGNGQVVIDSQKMQFTDAVNLKTIIGSGVITDPFDGTTYDGCLLQIGSDNSTVMSKAGKGMWINGAPYLLMRCGYADNSPVIEMRDGTGFVGFTQSTLNMAANNVGIDVTGGDFIIGGRASTAEVGNNLFGVSGYNKKVWYRRDEKTFDGTANNSEKSIVISQTSPTQKNIYCPGRIIYNPDGTIDISAEITLSNVVTTSKGGWYRFVSVLDTSNYLSSILDVNVNWSADGRIAIVNRSGSVAGTTKFELMIYSIASYTNASTTVPVYIHGIVR